MTMMELEPFDDKNKNNYHHEKQQHQQQQQYLYQEQIQRKKKKKQQRQQRQQLDSYHTKFAILLTMITLGLLCCLSLFYNYHNNNNERSSHSSSYNDHDHCNDPTTNQQHSVQQQQQQQQQPHQNTYLHHHQEEEEKEEQNVQQKQLLLLPIQQRKLLSTSTTTSGTGSNNNYNNNNNNNNMTDYSSYSCNYIYEITPQPGIEQCSFAKTCNGHQGIWAPFVFCFSNNNDNHRDDNNDNDNKFMTKTRYYCLFISPFMILYLILLFRFLSSTAEDYFSPSLEMFSTQCQLPPRFAGVTLLALGNGAADVSATVAAITNDPIAGYQLSLGALTGAAMVISGVISAIVILVASQTNDTPGLLCRGALTRDIIALIITVGTVFYELQIIGMVTTQTITTFLTLYCLFVCTVFIADVYHRAIIIPRMKEYNILYEQNRQIQLGQQELQQQQQQNQQEQQQQQVQQQQIRMEGQEVMFTNNNHNNNTLSNDVTSSGTVPLSYPIVQPGLSTITSATVGTVGTQQQQQPFLSAPPSSPHPTTGIGTRILMALSNYDDMNDHTATTNRSDTGHNGHIGNLSTVNSYVSNNTGATTTMNQHGLPTLSVPTIHSHEFGANSSIGTHPSGITGTGTAAGATTTTTSGNHSFYPYPSHLNPSSSDHHHNHNQNRDNVPYDPSYSGWGIESETIHNTERPIILHGAKGILTRPGHGHGPTTTSHHHHHHNNNNNRDGLHHIDDDAVVPMNYDDDNNNVSTSEYSMLSDHYDTLNHLCVDTDAVQNLRNYQYVIPENWSFAFRDTYNEFIGYIQSIYYDIVDTNHNNNDDNNDDSDNDNNNNGGENHDPSTTELNKFQRFLLLCELPFTLLRQFTVPIPCDGFYVKAVLPISIWFSPIWFTFYCYRNHNLNLLQRYPFFVLGIQLFATILSLLLIRYGPPSNTDKACPLPFHVSVPLALYGFIIAATWIDTIADSLVSLLNFIGIICNIPGPIIGLTVLAWGNSMGDLSANVTMAKKGLANMAITACFAGPVFNILVGLGLGFSGLLATTNAANGGNGNGGNTGVQVTLSSSITTGFVFLLLNSTIILITGLWYGKGMIPYQYGYVALLLYTVYVVTSITLQYH